MSLMCCVLMTQALIHEGSLVGCSYFWFNNVNVYICLQTLQANIILCVLKLQINICFLNNQFSDSSAWVCFFPDWIFQRSVCITIHLLTTEGQTHKHSLKLERTNTAHQVYVNTSCLLSVIILTSGKCVHFSRRAVRCPRVSQKTKE